MASAAALAGLAAFDIGGGQASPHRRRRVYGLARVSDQHQDMRRQIAAIRSIVDRYNLDLIGLIEAPDVRGREIATHPSVAQMIRDLQAGVADGVVVQELSRLNRPEDFDWGLIPIIKKSRKLVWEESSGCIDMQTSAGYLTVLMKCGMAGQEVDVMRSRSQGAKEAYRKDGMHPNSTICLPSIGLRWVSTGRQGGKKSGYWEYKDDAVLVVKAYEMLLDGAAFRQIQPVIGYGSPIGVKRLLQNYCWIGVRRYTIKKDDLAREAFSPKRQKTYRLPRQREEALEVEMRGKDGQPLEPLIPKAVWDRAQTILEDTRKLWRSKQKPSSLLIRADKLRCGCGDVLYHRSVTRNAQKPLYYCATRHETRKAKGIEWCGSPSFRREDFEATLEKALAEEMTPEYLGALFDKLQASQAKAPSKVTALRRQIDEIEGRLQRVRQTFEDGGMTREQQRERIADLTGRRKALEAQMPVETALPNLKPALRHLATTCTSIRRWTRDQKRAWYATAIESVTVENRTLTKITISGKFLNGQCQSDLAVGDKTRLRTCTQSQFIAMPDFEIPVRNSRPMPAAARWPVAA